MRRHEFPIIEYDPCVEAIINPAPGKEGFRLPERAVLCFPHDTIDSLVTAEGLAPVTHLKSAMGKRCVYAMEAFGMNIAVCQPGLCAPFAAASLDAIIALGVRKVVTCGTCGVLDSEMPKGMIVVPTCAVRDEGTSYHYLPPGREVECTQSVVPVIEDVLRSHDCHYVLGKTWTTDGFYRETPTRVKRRRDEGCLTVEMEAAAMFAVAKFRGIRMGMLLHCRDDVSGDVWDPRGDRGVGVFGGDEKIFWLAMEVCAKL